MPAQAIGSGLALRIGILRGRQLLEERILERPERVTIGQSRKNDICLLTDAVPRSFVLFEKQDDAFGIWLADSMDGRLSFGGDEVLSFAQAVRSDRAKGRGELRFVPLGPQARGKVLIGTDLAVLFQFVSAPPRLRPQLPPSLRVPLAQKLDVALLVILLISLSAHLGFAGYVSSLPPPRPPAPDDVPDRFVRMIVPQRTKKPEPKRDPKAPAKTPDKKAGSRPVPRPRELALPRRDVDPETARRLDDERKTRMREEVARTGLLKILGAKGEQGGAIENLIDKGAPASDQDRAFEGITGVADASAAKLRAVDGARDGAGRAASISDLRGGGIKDAGTGVVKAEREVAGVARQERANFDGELDQGQVLAEIRKRNGAIRRCYERGLKRNPALKGKVTLRFVITLAGTVSQVSLPEDDIGDPEVASCITSAVRLWRFPPASGSPATVEVPFVFSPSSG